MVSHWVTLLMKLLFPLPVTPTTPIMTTLSSVAHVGDAGCGGEAILWCCVRKLREQISREGTRTTKLYGREVKQRKAPHNQLGSMQPPACILSHPCPPRRTLHE